MKQTFKKIVSSALTLSTAVGLSGLGMVASAYAAPITIASASLSDVRSTTSSNHTFQFNVPTATAGTGIQAIKVIYSTQPSGAVSTPNSLVTSAATGTTVNVNASPVTGWTTATATAGTLTISNASGTGAISAGNTIAVTFNAITNNSALISGAGECDAIANSDTCYARITTYSDTAASVVLDTGVVSYTVIAPTVVTATVDPSLTFAVTGVSTLAAVNINDSSASCTGDDVVSTSTTIPFGNIRVGIAKCGQQALSVATNAQTGYKVYHKFIGTSAAADMMKGVNSANNLDPYTGNSTNFTTPTAFVNPTGAANIDSGWLGLRVKNPAGHTVNQFSTLNTYAPPAVSDTAIGNMIMDRSTPDNGNTPTYTTFKLVAGASQPADTYTGTMVYNVVATY